MEQAIIAGCIAFAVIVMFIVIYLNNNPRVRFIKRLHGGAYLVSINFEKQEISKRNINEYFNTKTGEQLSYDVYSKLERLIEYDNRRYETNSH